MELSNARVIANELVQTLAPFCDRIEIAGSLRRQKPQVHDIDIVALPNYDKMCSRGFLSTYPLVHFLAQANEETWATMLLIRTGSREHNIKLCSHARFLGYHLHANGDGLFNYDNQRIAGDSEESIFAYLELQYLPPERRD